MASPKSLIIHSGAGGRRFPEGDERFELLRSSVEEGMAAMRKGSSIDGVEAAVRWMEDSGRFNAGRGAFLNTEGRVQLDAAIMEGEQRRGGGVALCECTYNAVSLARAVLERTECVLIAGPACEKLARQAGMKTTRLRPSRNALERLAADMVAVQKESPTGNTVGAVAIDQDGVPAAAVSTGGVSMKMPGRIGDSAILGAGIYADSASGAACATGMGEEIIRCSLCWNACEYLKDASAASAAKKAMSLITKRSGKGTAGIITVDLKGRVGYAYNTMAMGRAWYDRERERVLVEI